MTGQALRLKERKDQLWRIYSHSEDMLDYARYTRCRNQLRSLTRRLRREFEANLARNIKANPKAFWRYSNTRLKTKSKLDDLTDESGSTVSDDSGKARLLNTFFSSIFTIESSDQMPEPPNQFSGPGIESITITAEMVHKKLLKLKTDSAPGPDGIHPKLLQLAAQSLAEPLASQFNESLDQGVLPDAWKTAVVVPIHKKGSKKEPGNYRPISLTCIPCKVMESLIRDELMEFLSSTDQISKHQHGFRPRRSCSSQLLETLEDWCRIIEQGDSVDVIYLDFRKAFDSVPHKRLLKKLCSYGISGKLLRWIEVFLSDRKQQVMVNGVHSDLVPVKSGVPKGSVLGPLLFLLYVNDIPSIVSCTAKMFADDTKIYTSMPKPRGNPQAVATEVPGPAVAPHGAGRDRPSEPVSAQANQTYGHQQHRSTEATAAEVSGPAVAPHGAGRDRPLKPESAQANQTNEQEHRRSTEATAAEVSGPAVAPDGAGRDRPLKPKSAQANQTNEQEHRRSTEATAAEVRGPAVAPDGAGRDRPLKPKSAQANQTNEQEHRRSTEATAAEVSGPAVAPHGAGRDRPLKPKSAQANQTNEQEHRRSTEATAAEVSGPAVAPDGAGRDRPLIPESAQANQTNEQEHRRSTEATAAEVSGPAVDPDGAGRDRPLKPKSAQANQTNEQEHRRSTEATAAEVSGPAVAPDGAGRDRPLIPESAQANQTNEQEHRRSTEATAAEARGPAVAPDGAGRDRPLKPESAQANQTSARQRHSDSKYMASRGEKCGCRSPRSKQRLLSPF